MNGPLTAGEPLAPKPPGPSTIERKRPRSRFVWVKRIVGGIVGLGFLALLSGGVLAYLGYRHYAADCITISRG